MTHGYLKPINYYFDTQKITYIEDDPTVQLFIISTINKNGDPDILAAFASSEFHAFAMAKLQCQRVLKVVPISILLKCLKDAIAK